MENLLPIAIGILFGCGCYLCMRRNIVRVLLGIMLFSQAEFLFGGRFLTRAPGAGGSQKRLGRAVEFHRLEHLAEALIRSGLFFHRRLRGLFFYRLLFGRCFGKWIDDHHLSG